MGWGRGLENAERVVDVAGVVDEKHVEGVLVDIEDDRPELEQRDVHHRMVQWGAAELAGATRRNVDGAIACRGALRRLLVGAVAGRATVAAIEDHR